MSSRPEMIDGVYFSRVRKEILPLLPAAPGRYLEIGCGTGATLAHLRELGLATWTAGIEFGEGPAAQAAKLLDFVRQGDIEAMELSFEPASFDVILCLDVLEHLRDPWTVVQRLTALLKPDGALIVSLPNIRYYKVVLPLLFRGDWTYQDAGILDRTHLRFFVRRTAVELVEAGGLKVDAVLAHRIKRWKLKWILNKLLFGLLTDHLVEQFLLRAKRR